MTCTNGQASGRPGAGRQAAEAVPFRSSGKMTRWARARKEQRGSGAPSGADAQGGARVGGSVGRGLVLRGRRGVQINWKVGSMGDAHPPTVRISLAIPPRQ